MLGFPGMLDTLYLGVDCLSISVNCLVDCIRIIHSSVFPEVAVPDVQ